MSLISARCLTKRFTVPVKSPGLVGATKHLLRPRYEEIVAVDSLDLSVEAGESIALIGPNGAGKSTTIKMLTGILVPSSGELRVMGMVPYRNRTENARHIGAVFGQRSQLWWDLPVYDSLRLLGDIYQVPREVFARNLSAFVDLLDLGPLLSVPARRLSLGQRMRCDLASALLHDPPLLYLDEPTIGLDVVAKKRIRQFIKHANCDRATTVMLTSHDLDDIENLCRRLIIIDHGKAAYDGSIQMIRERFGRDRVMHLSLREPVPDAVQRCRALLPGQSCFRMEQSEPDHLLIHFDVGDTTAGAVASHLLPALPVRDLQIEAPSIESIIGRIYEGQLLSAEARG